RSLVRLAHDAEIRVFPRADDEAGAVGFPADGEGGILDFVLRHGSKMPFSGGRGAIPRLIPGDWGINFVCSIFREKRSFGMKADIHPKYTPQTFTCSCGNVIELPSTISGQGIEICSNCHPFFTGKQKMIDSGG